MPEGPASTRPRKRRWHRGGLAPQLQGDRSSSGPDALELPWPIRVGASQSGKVLEGTKPPVAKQHTFDFPIPSQGGRPGDHQEVEQPLEEPNPEPGHHEGEEVERKPVPEEWQRGRTPDQVPMMGRSRSVGATAPRGHAPEHGTSSANKIRGSHVRSEAHLHGGSAMFLRGLRSAVQASATPRARSVPREAPPRPVERDLSSCASTRVPAARKQSAPPPPRRTYQDASYYTKYPQPSVSDHPPAYVAEQRPRTPTGPAPRARSAGPTGCPSGRAAASLAALIASGSDGSYLVPDKSDSFNLGLMIVSASQEAPVEELLRFVSSHLEEFSASNCITAVHRLAKLKEQNPANTLRLESDLRFKRLLSRLKGVDFLTCAVRDFSNLSWALVKLEAPMGGEQFRLMAVALCERSLGSFPAAAIANLCWAFVKADSTYSKGAAPSQIGVARVMQHLGKEILLRGLQGFGPQDFSNISWGFARLSEPVPQELVDMMVEEIESRSLANFESQHLCNLAWSLSRLTVDTQVLGSRRLCDEITGRDFGAFTSVHLVNIAWSFARWSRIDSHELLQRIYTEVLSRGLYTLAVKELSNFVWALAKYGSRPEYSGDANLIVNGTGFIAQELTMRGVGDCVPQCLGNVAWACTQVRCLKGGKWNSAVGVPRPEIALVRSIAREVRKRSLGSFSGEDLLNLAWAFTKSGLRGEDAVEESLSKIEKERAKRDLRAGKGQGQQRALSSYGFRKGPFPEDHGQAMAYPGQEEAANSACLNNWGFDSSYPSAQAPSAPADLGPTWSPVQVQGHHFPPPAPLSWRPPEEVAPSVVSSFLQWEPISKLDQAFGQPLGQDQAGQAAGPSRSFEAQLEGPPLARPTVNLVSSHSSQKAPQSKHQPQAKWEPISADFSLGSSLGLRPVPQFSDPHRSRATGAPGPLRKVSLPPRSAPQQIQLTDRATEAPQSVTTLSLPDAPEQPVTSDPSAQHGGSLDELINMELENEMNARLPLEPLPAVVPETTGKTQELVAQVHEGASQVSLPARERDRTDLSCDEAMGVTSLTTSSL